MALRKTVPLADQLVAKGAGLRAQEASDAQASQALAVASAEAAKSSAVAASHAAAVEKAIKILDDAGVQL